MTQHPSDSGREAARAGLKPKDNPHVFGSRGYKQWINGYTRERRKPTKGKQA